MEEHTADSVQQDWSQREFIEMLQLNMAKIVNVLNLFDSSTRVRLSQINDRLGVLERDMEYLEALLKTDEGKAP